MVESKSKTGSNEEVKIFKDLEDDVINKDMCCACGACVAYCESQSFDVIELKNDKAQFKSKKNADNCTDCGVCYYICPQTSVLLDKLDISHEVEDENGHVIDLLAAKTTDKAIDEVGQDGGIVTTILSHLFDTHKIDAAVVSEYDQNWDTKPKLVYDKEDLLKSGGTRYSISSQILPLKDLYNISLEIIDKKGIYDLDQLRVAFVGTPCQCRAISKMKLLNIKPAHVIKYNISLFCFENFNHDELYSIIEKETKVKPKDIRKTWIKKNFFVKDKDENVHEVGIKVVDPAVRHHCHECDEFTGRYSDISVGAQGAPAGYSMIVIRTETGQKAINELIFRGLIERQIVPSEQAVDWKSKKLGWFKKLLSFKTK